MAIQAPDAISNRYYVIDKIGEGGMGAVYLVRDRLTNDTVALKRVTMPSSQLDFASRASISDTNNYRLALAQEFKTLATLRHPHIISVLDYGFDEKRQPYFTMDYLSGAQSVVQFGQRLSVNARVNLLIQILQALAYLHRRGIIHRDLKPGNVVVVDSQVKVLDFGLAVAREHIDSDEANSLIGTLAYMAPEIVSGHNADEASDLYAVGVMAYELFAGTHPFNVKTINQLINEILTAAPDFAKMDVSQDLLFVVMRLLDKDPESRYRDANQVIDELNAAINQVQTAETKEIRESYLQAANFVGRDAEYDQLRDALTQTASGTGTGWLVGGESGAGKSRLLEELRTHALVQGVQVVRGQAIAERGTAYGIWQATLRYICLYTNLSPLEASVLSAIVPDLKLLLAMDIPEAPIVDPQTSRNRLFDVLEQIFLRQDKPLLVILEDLHWADSESIAVVERISRHLQKIPVLLIGSYRDDERPSLPTELSALTVLKLARLSEEAISNLSAAMLGDEIGRRDGVVDLLKRESEGNIFFIVEVVRALAEEAGTLSNLKEWTLPLTVFAKGIATIVQRRLSKVPESGQTLLQLAAILGRYPDIAILKAADPNQDIDQWLTQLSEASVMDVQDNRWRFAHDKLREGILDAVPEEARPSFHKQAAEITEKLYPNSAEHYDSLAYHWAKAGSATKEYHYSILASERALSNNAYPTAITFLERALELHPSMPANIAKSEYYLYQQLGSANLSMGRMSIGREHLERSLTLRGYQVGKNQFEVGLGILSVVARQTMHRLLPSVFVKKSDKLNTEYVEVAEIYDQLADIYFFANDVFRTLEAQTRALNLAEQAGGVSKALARCYSSMCTIAGSMRMRGLAEQYVSLSNKAMSVVNESATEAYVWMAYSLYYVGSGQWQRLTDATSHSLEICETIGDSRVWGMNMIVVSAGAQFQSQFRAAHDYFLALRQGGERINDPTQTIVGMTGQANCSFHLYNVDECWEVIDAAFKQGDDLAGNVHAMIQLYALQGILHLHQDNKEKALELATTADKILANELPTNPFSMLYFNYLAEIYLYLMSVGYRKEEMEKNAARTLSGFGLFAGNFPIGRAAANRWRGLLAWQRGKTEEARRHWDNGLADAETMSMPYEGALIKYEIGRHLPASSSERQSLLQQARETFTRLETPYDLQRVETALAETQP